jgi:lysophospholipase L1-like esterase
MGYNKSGLNPLSDLLYKYSGVSPQGTYPTLTALQSAFPSGDNSNVYIVKANNSWYYWNGLAWTVGGIATFGTNLFNQATTTQDQYVFGGSDGHVAANGTYSVGYYASDWIPVDPNTQYAWLSKSLWAVYDANKGYIYGENFSLSGSNTYTTPSNAAYMRISSAPGNLSKEMFVKGSVVPSNFVAYQAPSLTLSNGTSLSTPSVNYINTLLKDIPKIKSSNLYNQATALQNQYVFGNSDGHVGANGTYSNGYYASDWIPVKPNTQYTWKSGGYWAVYDSNKNYITGEGSTSTTTYKTPYNAGFMRISSTNPTSEMLVEGSSIPSTYSPYGYNLTTYNNASVSIQANSQSRWYGKNVLAIGDSLTAALQWQNTVASTHGCTITTHALGGIDIVGMVDGTTNSNGTIAALSTSDVTGKDLIILFGGMNERSTTYGTQFISNPTTPPAIATATSGGTVPAGTYYVKYTWISSSGGETAASSEASVTTTGSTSTITVTVPSLPAGCSQTNIYISSSSGSETYQGNTTTTTYTQSAAITTTGNGTPTISTALSVYPSSNTLFGKMQYAINKLYSLLQSAGNNNCKIMIVAPHCCGKYPYINADGYAEYPAGTGQTLEKLVNNLITSANYNNIRAVDLWHKSGVNRNTWNVYMSSSTATVTPPSGSTAPYPSNGDQVHFNSIGYARIGEAIAAEMNLI